MRNVSKIWGISSNENSLLDHVSFMCVRTNPKLSTNVRLVTNGDRIWLDSYPATKELSENRYKAFLVSGNGMYNKDVARFYKGLDYSIPYTVFQGYDDTTVKTTYDAQYETFYWCGTEYVTSLEYDDEFGITAPLWLDEKIPDLFVVFRVPGPSYISLAEARKDGQDIKELDFKTDILEKCEIIKTFDLSGNSRFGSYIRKYFNQEGFPEEPLHAKLGVGEPFTYKGFSIENGSMLSVPEYCRDRLFNDDETITKTDEYVTCGFERNRIACANLLNIEFLFNDPSAEDYTANRYFGLYCNFLEDVSCRMDFGGFADLSAQGNTVAPQGNDIPYSKTEIIVKNGGGVLIPFENVQNHDLFPYAGIVSQLNSVFCILDKNGELHNIKSDGVSSGNVQRTARVSETEIDLMKFTGFVTDGKYIDVERRTESLCSQIEITVNDEIPIGLGLVIKKKTPDGLADVCAVVCDYSPDGCQSPCWANQGRFCGRGTSSQIALAIAKSVNMSSSDDVSAFCLNDKVVVRSRLAASEANKFVLIPSVVQNGELVSSAQYIGNILDIAGVGADGVWGFYGGTSYDHLRVTEENAGYFKPGLWLKTNTRKGWGRITGVAMDYTSLAVSENGIAVPKGKDVFYNVVLDGDGVSVTNNSQAAVYTEYIPKIGRLSFFPVRDFDFSTYENPSVYGDLGELDEEYKEMEADVLPDAKQESEDGGNGKTEVSFGIGSKTIMADLLYGGGVSVKQSGDVIVKDAGNDEYSIEMPVVITDNSYADTTVQVNRNGFTFETLNTTLFGNKETLGNEYDMFLENYSKDCMFLSKTVPFISKWVCHGNSLNVREKPYRLNTSMAFGLNSFSPNPYMIEPSPEDFNQEWLYVLEKYPFGYSTSGNSWSYLDIHDPENVENTNLSDFEYQGGNLEDLLRSTETNYFDILFVQDFMKDGQAVYDHLYFKRKYSLFEKGSNLTNSETFFRGARIEVLQKVDYAEEVDDNLENILTDKNPNLNGYKFTAVAVPYVADYDEGLNKRKTKVIRNDRFGFIVVLVYTARKIYGAVEHLNGSSSPQSLRYKKLTRYFMYEPDTCLNEAARADTGSAQSQNISLYPNLSVFGTGMVSKITRDVSSGEELYDVYGIGTSFLTDFDFDIRGTSAHSSNNFVLLKHLVSHNEDDSVPVVMFGFKVKEIKSDTHLVARKDETACGVFSAPGFYVSGDNNYADSSITDGMFVILKKSMYAISDEIRKCTFGNVYYNINHFQKDNVVYEHVSMENGEWRVLSSENGEWSYALKILPPELHAKYRHRKMLCDNRHIYYSSVPDSAVQISRQSGYYTPLFRDVLYFKDPFVREALEDESSRVVDFLRNSRYCNTVFACGEETFGIIKSMCFHRANGINNNVFGLTEGRQPIYPIQNKFSVGRREYNVFNSNWDPWYFTETNSETQETDIHGTNGMLEKSSMLGSKCMKTPDGFLFDTFSYGDFTISSRSNLEVFVSIENGNASFRIDVRKKLLNVLNENLKTLFESYVNASYSYGDKTTVDDDIEQYASDNLLQLYRIDKVRLYVKSIAAGEMSVDWSFISEDDSLKAKNGLSVDKNVLSVYSDTDELVSNLSYKLSPGNKYMFGISVDVVKK